MSTSRRVLVVGWFSYELHGATAGDLISRDQVCEWLAQSGVEYAVAVAPPFTDGVPLDSLDPANFSDVVFVCGPFGNGEPVTGLIDRFRSCKLHGVNLSMLQPLRDWNPFSNLIERDSSRASRPDLSFVSHVPSVPIMGVVLVHHQEEYGARGLHQMVDTIIQETLLDLDVAPVMIDTRLDVNATSLRTPAQVESLIARMDLVVTTRLHGTVLSLKNGVPVVVIDPIAGGAKVTRQAQTIGWPVLIKADQLTSENLRSAISTCLTPAKRSLAHACGTRARSLLDDVRQRFLAGLGLDEEDI